MKPVFLPQYVPKDMVLGNSIIHVAGSLASGLRAAGGRLVAPVSEEVVGYMPDPAWIDADLVKTVSRYSTATGITFEKNLYLADDEYLVNLTPLMTGIVASQTKLKGSIYERPPVVSYVPLSPCEVEDRLRIFVATLVEYPTVFNSAHCRDEWLHVARKHLSVRDVALAVSSWKVSHIGIDCDAIDAEASEREPGTFALCGRLISRNGYLQTAELLDTAYKTGAKVAWHVSTFGSRYAPALAALREKHGFVVPYNDLTRKEYHRLIGRCSAFLCCAQDESYGLSWLEKLYAGQVGIFWDRPWVRAMLPGYPYLAKSALEAVTMVKKVASADGLAEMRGGTAWVRDYIRTEHNQNTASARFFAVAEHAIQVRS